MQVLRLTDRPPLSTGYMKLVFRHPSQPGALIKVIKPAHVHEIRRRWPLLTRIQRLGHYLVLLRELTDHIAMRASDPAGIDYVQNITGLVDTDLGMGLVVEAVTRRDGELADTLARLLAERRFTAMHARALQEFCTWLSQAPLVIRDLGARNLVWHEAGSRFVLIDGFGEYLGLTLRSFWPAYNRRHNRRKAAKLLQRVTAAAQRAADNNT